MTPFFKRYGPNGVLIVFGDKISSAINDHVLATYWTLVKAIGSPEVRIQSGYSDIMILYNYNINYDQIIAEIENVLIDEINHTYQPKKHHIIVDFHPTLNDWEKLTKHTGQSQDLIIQSLVELNLKVMMTGFLPGFPYLGPLPHALSCPRLTNPRTHVPKGSLAIGGNQLGIYPTVSPGGWHIIGHVDLELFTLESGPLLKLGDQVNLIPKMR